MLSILAHFGGVDEVGIYVLPIFVAIVLLRWAEKRARSAAKERERE